MEEAVERGWAAFSAEEARRRGVEWLDLVRSKELGAKLAALAAEFERDGYRPEALRAQVSQDEARKRWGALVAFHKAHGHFLVTNGPYKLKAWSAESVTLEAFRDLTYPLGVGSYDAYAVPRRGFVTGTEWKGDRLVVSGDIEVIDKFQRSYRLVRTPLKSVPADVLRRAAPECRYMVVAEDGRVALAGASPIGADASFADRSRGSPGAGPLHAIGRHRRQRQRHEPGHSPRRRRHSHRALNAKRVGCHPGRSASAHRPGTQDHKLRAHPAAPGSRIFR